MIIWTGFGFVIPLICLVNLLLFEWLDPYLEIVNSSSNLMFVGLFSTLMLFGANHLLEKYTKSKVLIDPETQEEVVLRSSHSLFFIPVKYWRYIFIVGTVYLIIKYFV